MASDIVYRHVFVAILIAVSGCSVLPKFMSGADGPGRVASGPRGEAPHEADGRWIPAPIRSEGRVWLRPAIVSGQVWFADELEPLTDAVAEVLSREPYNLEVIPPAQLRELWSRNSDEERGGALRCRGAHPSLGALAHYVYPGAAYGLVSVNCAEETGCQLVVELVRGRRRDGTEERLGLSLPADDPPQRWADHVRLGSFEELGPARHAFDYFAQSRVTAQITYGGSWLNRVEEKEVKELLSSLEACEQGTTARRDQRTTMLLGVDGEGRLSRCEDPSAASPPGFSCKCEVLRGLTFEEGEADRRLGVSVGAVGRRHPPRTLWVGSLRASDPTAVIDPELISNEALSRCGEGQERMREAIGLRVEVGPDGRVQTVETQWSASLPEEVASCVRDVVKETRFNCPLSGEAVINATIRVAVGDEGGR